MLDLGISPYSACLRALRIAPILHKILVGVGFSGRRPQMCEYFFARFFFDKYSTESILWPAAIAICYSKRAFNKESYMLCSGG
jgi:hypothetical protein